MKKYSFVISAIILALGGFFAKAIGAIYKIPLTNILGSSGIGLYYLIFPIYSLIIVLCSSGISVALSCEVSKCRSVRHIYNEHKLLRVALVITFLISTFFSILVVFMSKKIATLQGNVNAYVGYIAISPAIILSSIIATVRGYFQGIENMVPTTISLIVEQIVKLSVGLILAHILCPLGVGYAVFGAILGVTISEVVAFIIIVINYISYKGQLFYNYRNIGYKTNKIKLENNIFKNKKYIRVKNNIKPCYYRTTKNKQRYTNKIAFIKLLKIAIPTTLSSIILPIATMIDSFLIINLLVKSGYSSFISTSLYGLFGGVVQSLISLPIIIISGVSTSLVPSLSGLIAKNDSSEINKRVAFFIKITWVMSIILFILMFVFTEDYIEFLYGDGLNNNVISEFDYLVKMMRFSSISIIYYSFLQTFISIFQSIGKSFIPFVVLFLGLVFRSIFEYILLLNPKINIFGAIISNILFLIFVSLIFAILLKKYININFVFFNGYIKPVIIGFIVMFVGFLLDWAMKSIMHYFLSMIISLFVCTILYLTIIYFSNVFTIKEKKYLPFSSKNFKKNR